MMYRVDAKIQAFAFIVFMSSYLATETVGLKLNASRVRSSWNKSFSRLRHNEAKVFKKSSSRVQNVGPSEILRIDVTSDARPGVVHVSSATHALNTAVEKAEQNLKCDKSGNRNK